VCFLAVYFVAVLAVALAGSELIVWSSVPPWPARELRPIPMGELSAAVADVFSEAPELVPAYNEWGMRDRQRTTTRPANVSFRATLVGDSFLEGYFASAPLSELVERH
jgi:hypothetical protein